MAAPHSNAVDPLPSGPGSLWSARRTLLGAVVLASALLALHFAWTRSHHPETYRVRRGELPGFDAYVYVAMAENPTIFTLAPWGYRLLTPALVHVLPGRTARGFRIVTLASLLAAAVCLALFLRRVGHRPLMVGIGVALFVLSPFIGVFLQSPFLVDPLAVALLTALLFAVESRAGVATLALLATLGTAAKEVMLVLAPLLCWARSDAVGRGRALREAALVTLPAIAFTLVLHFRWHPASPGPAPRLDADVLAGLAAVVARSTRHWLLFGGLMPLALIGLADPQTRAYLRRYGPALAVALVLPLAYTAVFPASLNYLRAELPRYALYVLPLLIPVALGAGARWWPAVGAVARASPPPSATARRIAWAATLVLIGGPAFLLDPYRRADLHGRDGERLLALTRQGPKVAAAIARGEAVVLDLEAAPFLSVDGGREAYAVPWFLTEGWQGTQAQRLGQVLMRGRQAVLVVPLLAPHALDLSLTLSAPADVALQATVNGTELGTARVGREPAAATFRLPASALVRGENTLTLTAEKPAPVRLHRVSLEPAS